MTAPLLGYQYAVLRCVPRVDRDEFLNVGIVLYCQSADFLDAAFELNPARLRALSPGLDVDAVERTLQTVCAVCRGERVVGLPVIDALGPRFGWLSAPRSTVVQPGPRHGGLTHDPAVELARLKVTLLG